MRNNNIILFRFLCRDLGLTVRRDPTVIELGLARNVLLKWLESGNDQHLVDLQMWLDSWTNVRASDYIPEIYQITSLLLKVKREPTNEQQENYIKAFKATENYNRAYCPDPKNIYLRTARQIVRYLTQSLSLKADDVLRRAHHGPGATFEKANKDDKSYYALRSFYQYNGVFPADWMYACYSLDQIRSVPDYDKFITAALELVPKDHRGPRGVFISPCSAVFLQLGIDSCIKDWVTSNQVMKQVWHPYDQSPSQEFAFIGSYNRMYATLDLKDASDRVTLDLVRYLFHREHYKMFAATRPSYVLLPNGERIRIRMLSPMGDGKTFAVLSLVCSSLSLAGMLVKDGHHPSRPLNVTKLVELSKSLRVFGDDVAVRSDYFDNVVEALESGGLVINRSKSFVNGYFRESCGMDAFHGVDITPIRLKVDLDSYLDDRSVQSLIALYNRMRYRYPRLVSAANWILSIIRSRVPHITYTTNFVRSPYSIWCEDVRRVIGDNLKAGRKIRLSDYHCLEVHGYKGLDSLTSYQDPDNDWYRYNYRMFPCGQSPQGEGKSFIGFMPKMFRNILEGRDRNLSLGCGWSAI